MGLNGVGFTILTSLITMVLVVNISSSLIRHKQKHGSSLIRRNGKTHVVVISS